MQLIDFAKQELGVQGHADEQRTRAAGAAAVCSPASRRADAGL